MKSRMPLTGAQIEELNFSPPDFDCLPEKEAATAVNLRGCVVYIIEKGGRGYWYYVEGARGDTLTGYRRVGRDWVARALPVERIARYY